MSFWNSDSGYGDMMGEIQDNIYKLPQYRTKALNVSDLDARTNSAYADINRIGLNNLLAGLGRAVGQRGNSAVAQGYRMNLSNPFAMKNLMEAEAYDSFSPQFGNLNQMIAQGKGQAMMQNPLTAWNTQYQSDQAQLNALLSLLGMKSNVASQRAQNEFGIHSLLPGLIQAGGQYAAASAMPAPKAG